MLQGRRRQSSRIVARADGNLPAQTVKLDAAPRHVGQAGLHLDSGYLCGCRLPGQEERDNAASRAQVDDGSGGNAGGEMGEQNGIQ